MTTRPLKSYVEIVAEATRMAITWTRMQNRKNRLEARIAHREQSNTADRATLVRLNRRDEHTLRQRGVNVMAYVLPRWVQLADDKGKLVELGPVTVERYLATQGALIMSDGEEATVGELLDLYDNSELTRENLLALLKITVKRDALKAHPVLRRLQTAYAERGEFYAFHFPAVKDAFRRPAAYWHKLVDDQQSTVGGRSAA